MRRDQKCDYRFPVLFLRGCVFDGEKRVVYCISGAMAGQLFADILLLPTAVTTTRTTFVSTDYRTSLAVSYISFI